MVDMSAVSAVWLLPESEPTELLDPSNWGRLALMRGFNLVGMQLAPVLESQLFNAGSLAFKAARNP